MQVTKKQITQAIEKQIKLTTDYLTRHPDHVLVKGSIPVIFVQQVSARRYEVGWRYSPVGTKVGDIQQDYSPAFNKAQEIVWVYGEDK